MEEQCIPANLHYNDPNPDIPGLTDGRLKVVSSSTKWSEGFSFKGVYFKLLPYEDATHVLEEIKALNYI